MAMTNILCFDSIHIIKPFRIIYIRIIQRLLEVTNTPKKRLILYRLDKENFFIRDDRNISGISIGVDAETIDAESIKFYRYLEKTISCPEITIKNQPLYSLYTRQMKLKLAEVLKCTYRIIRIANESSQALEIVSDKQTIEIIKQAFIFLEYKSNKIKWVSKKSLTLFTSLNSILMRLAAIARMVITPHTLPNVYFVKHISSDLPSILISMPRRRPDDFYNSYINQLDGEFNIYIYSVGFIKKMPAGYKQIKIKRSFAIIHGLFKLKYMFLTPDSYIADVLLIFKNHNNLNISLDAVNTMYENKIDAHISRLQTNVLDNFLAIVARKKRVFVFGDVMEEIFYCDGGVCSSKSNFSESIKLAFKNDSQIAFKGLNSNINYRLSNFTLQEDRYIHKLAGIDFIKKVIFYASDPSKDQSQRYLTEKFLFNQFSKQYEYIFVIKTHTQDDGMITFLAYLDAGSPANVVLIGDETQKNNIASEQFQIFPGFDFNSAIASSNGFLTSSSSSILQSILLGTKSGIVDLFKNNFYGFLIQNKAAILINDRNSLINYLGNDSLEINNDTLEFCGLKSQSKFDLGMHLSTGIKQYYQ
jgi:hypothetical protein